MLSTLTHDLHGAGAIITRLDQDSQGGNVIIVGTNHERARDTLHRIADHLGNRVHRRQQRKVTTHSGLTIYAVSAQTGDNALRGRTARLVTVPPGVHPTILHSARLVTTSINGHIIAINE